MFDEPLANLFVAGFIGSPSMNLIQARLAHSDGDYHVETGSMKIGIPQQMGRRASAYVGKEIIFGLRPEDIYSQTNCPPALNNTADCDVFLVENMGNDLYVHVSRDNHSFIARLSPDTQVKEEASHPMSFDTQKCHLFDKESGENLTLDNYCPSINGRFCFLTRLERFCNRRHSGSIPRINKSEKRKSGDKRCRLWMGTN